MHCATAVLNVSPQDMSEVQGLTTELSLFGLLVLPSLCHGSDQRNSIDALFFLSGLTPPFSLN